MKKVLILILAVIMLIAAAGCSGTPATTGSSSSNPATPFRVRLDSRPGSLFRKQRKGLNRDVSLYQ